MKNKPTATIGIAAYNADKNIGQILASITSQIADNYILKEIIVHSDASQDNTVLVASGINDSRIQVIDNKKRRGFAGTIKYLFDATNTDLLVILNDDIRINDPNFINKLVEPFTVEDGVGLTCGYIYPLTPRDNFVEKMAVSAVNIYNSMRQSIKNPNNRFTYDGVAMTLSKQLRESINFSSDTAEVGNGDGYLYYSCLANGFKYRGVKDAKIYFRAPSTLSDYIARISRNTAQSLILKRVFGDLITKSYKKPGLLFFRCYMQEFIRNPIGCFVLPFLGLYTRLKAKKVSENFNPKWDTVESTKTLS